MPREVGSARVEFSARTARVVSEMEEANHFLAALRARSNDIMLSSSTLSCTGRIPILL